MRISEIVHTLSGNMLASQSDSLTPRHHVLLELFRLMPLYCEARRLDAWERAVLEALPRVNDASDVDKSEIGRLIEELFEFARLKLYTSFDPAGTAASYGKLSKLLRDAGVNCPTVFLFSGY